MIRILQGLAIVFACLACAAAAAAQVGSAEISGAVVSKQSGQPVAGAAVSVEGGSLTAQTTAGGRFRIDGVPAGAVVLVVKAPGFLDLRTTDVSARTGETTQITVELEPTP